MQAFWLTPEPKAGTVSKIHAKPDRNRNNIWVSSRTGPRTARLSESVLEPDPEPPDNMSQF